MLNADGIRKTLAGNFYPLTSWYDLSYNSPGVLHLSARWSQMASIPIKLLQTILYKSGK